MAELHKIKEATTYTIGGLICDYAKKHHSNRVFFIELHPMDYHKFKESYRLLYHAHYDSRDDFYGAYISTNIILDIGDVLIG